MAARGFSLTAEINLRGPTNIRPIVNNIRRQLGSINANVNLNINRTTLGSIRQVNTSLGTLNTTLAATTSATTSAAQAFTNLAAAMRSVGNVNLPQTVQAPMVRLASSANNASAAVSRTRTEFEDFGRQAGLAVRRFAAFSAVTSVIYGFSNALSAGIKQYIEFDRQITRLSQVTNESKASLSSMTSEITRLSTSMGVASEDLAQVSVTLAQAGFTAAETRKALEALAKSALAPSFDSLNQTVEGSIALMRQFGITANQLEGALGSINAVAAGFAVEASDLIAAIQRTGGVFASASRGVSSGTDALNEFLAVFTSIRATTRESAETIATGLRTIFTRIQRGDTIEALKEYGVQLTDLEGKFVGPYVAVQRLAEGLGRLDPRDLKFSQIVEELGGFRQIGKVLPLIQQFATAQDALKIAQQGQGSLATDAAKGQLALAVQIQKVREEFTALVRSVGDSDGFKTMVRLGLDLASALIKIADATKGVLPLIGIMAAFRGVSALTQFAGGFGGGFRGTRRADGGRIYGFARGGIVPGSGNTDSVPAMLTPGEFVMNKQAVNKYGRGNLVRMNRYDQGGIAVKAKDMQRKKRSSTSVYVDNLISDNQDSSLYKQGKAVNTTDSFVFKKKIYSLYEKNLVNPTPENNRAFEEAVAKKTKGRPVSSDDPNTPIDVVSSSYGRLEVRNRKQSTSSRTLLDKLIRYLPQNKLKNSKNKSENINLGQIGIVYNSAKYPVPNATELSSGGAAQKVLGASYIQKLLDGGWVKRMKQQDKKVLKKDLETLKSAMLFAGDTGAYIATYDGSGKKEMVDPQELKERYQSMSDFVIGKKSTTRSALKPAGGYNQEELLDAVTYYQSGSGPLARAMVNKDFIFIDRKEEYTTEDVENRLKAAAQYKLPKKLYSGLGRGQFNEILSDTKIDPKAFAKNPSQAINQLSGQTVDFPTFLSTSKDYKTAEAFIGKPGALMSIDSSKTKQKGIDVLKAKQTANIKQKEKNSRRLPELSEVTRTKLAMYDAEEEMILNPNTKFKILSAKMRMPSSDDDEFDSAEDYYASMVESYQGKASSKKQKTKTSEPDLTGIKLDLAAQMLRHGGMIQKFAEAGAVKEATRIRDRVSALAQSKGKSIQETLLEQLKGLGGPAGVRTILGIGSGDSLTRSVLNANNIKANKGIETAKDYVNRALFVSGKNDAAEAKRIAGLTQVAIAGLLPMGYSDTNEWALPESGKTIYATIKGFDKEYLPAAQQMSRETALAARNFAENVQYTKIFGGKEKLVFDFDETLVSGVDILNEEGKPDIPRYSDRTVVEEYLKRGRLTRLGAKLKTLIDADPEFIKNTRILTARPASTVDLLAQSLQSFGLPYQASDITGVGGEGVKVPRAKSQNLAKTEKLIDDSLDNIRAVQKSKKSGFLYTEPQAKPELDELMGQGNIEGAVIEKALAILGANLPPIETLESNRAVDFPGGLGRAAQFFGLPDNIPTEVKRTLNGSAFEKARGEFDRYYKEQAIGLAEGGTVPALVSNGEAYVPPKLAKRIGYGKLNKMNQADRNGMGRFADGGISVFKGPGTGTSDSIPANLPVGSFVIREKATKALGLNRGGAVGVQRFVFGGGPSARPDTISPETIGVSGTTVTALRQLSKVLEELGVTSSRSAQLLARGYQATAAEAEIAYRADLNMARAAGASAEVIYDLERALQNSQEQVQREISIREFFARTNAGGEQLQKILFQADDILGDLTNRARRDAASRGLTGDELEAEVRSGAELRRREAFERAGGATTGIDLRKMGANGSDLERVINVLMRDAKTLEQMNEQYKRQRREAVALERENAGDAAAAARARDKLDQDLEDAIKREIQARNDSIRDVAQAEGSADRGIRETDRNMGFMASAAIISVGSIIASNLNVKSSATNAGIAAGIQSGSSTFGTGYGFSNEIGRFADSLERVGGSAARFGSRLLKFGSGLTLATTGIFAVVDSFNAYQNAVNEFNLDLAKKKFEQSLSGFQEELDKATKNTALTLDVLNSKIESASERYTKVLDTLGKQTTATWSNLLQRLGDRLGFSKIDPRDLAKESRIRELGGEDAADRAMLSDDARRVEYDAIIPQIAQEQAALGKAQAEAALNLLRTRLQRGESSDDVINSPQFDSISNLLANSNQSIREQLLRIENSGLDDATIAQQKKELIAQYGKEQILLEATIVKREKDSKSMSVLTSVYTRSLSRMFDNMSQAISSTNFALKELTDNADLTAKALSGQAQAGNINLKTIDVLRNPRGYNRFEQESAINGAAGFFGTRADIMPGLLGGAEAAQATIMSTINDTLEKNLGANNETIGRAIDANLRTVFANLALPPELADKLAKEVGLTVADLRKNNDDVIDFSLLTEKISSLGRVMESFQGAQNSAIEAVQAYQNVLNIYTQQTNDLIELSVSQRQKERQASDILISAYNNLQRTLGQSINLQDSQNRLATRVQGFTGQAETDPGVIFNRVLQLNRQREVAESGRRTAGERNLGGIDDFTKFNKDLERSSVALRENYQALKFLAENTEYAADAMSKIQDAQQKIGGRVSFIEKIVTSTPEELDNLGSAVNRLQRNMNGQLNTMNSSVGAQKAYNEAIRNGANAAEAMKAAQMAFANERKDTLGALNDLLPFLGSGRETNNIRANVLESMLRESGMGVSPMFAQVLNSLRNPETDPETAAAIEYYNEANNLQAEANRYLAKIENELAKDKAAVQAQALIDGLKAVTLKFESQELKDLNANINRLVPIQPQAKAQGGVIYAAAGQMVDFRSRGTDTVPAMLTPGEFVVNRSATQKHLPLLQSINSNKYSAGGKVRYYADGGYVHNFITNPDQIAQADQISQEKIIDFTDENAKTAFDMNYKKEFYSIPAQFTFINPDKQLPETDDNTLDPDMTKLKPSNGQVVPGIGPAYYLRRQDPVFGTPSFGYNPVNPTVTSKKVVSNTEILPPDITPKHIRQTEFDQWKKAAGSRVNNLLDPPSLITDFVTDYPSLTDFAGLFQKDKFQSTLTDATKILGITDITGSAGNLRKAPEKGYRIWEQRTTLDNANAIAQSEPIFNDGPYAGKAWNNRIPGQTALRTESKADVVGKQYETLIDSLKGRYKVYKDTWDFADNPLYKTGAFPLEVQTLLDKLATVYAETQAFVMFGDKDGINLNTYFDRLTDLAGTKQVRSLMVFKANDTALKEAVELYDQRPDLAQNVLVGWKGAGVAAKDYITNKELEISGWGNMNHLKAKEFPWILNGEIEHLPEETRKEMEENVKDQNPGDIKVRLKTTKGKMAVPGIGNILPQFANEKIDFTYAYDEWIGKLYDPTTRTFEPNVVPQPLLLPQNIKGSIFEESNLDIDKYRFMGSDQFSPAQIVLDRGKNKDLMNYYSAIINNNDAEKQRILPNLKGAFKYQWNNRRWIGASFGAIPALNKDLADAKANPVDITTFILKQAENLLTNLGAKAGQADTGFAKLRSSNIPDNELPSVVRNLSKGALRLFGSRNIPGFAKNWLYSYIGRVPFMQNMNPAFAKNVSQNISGVLDQAGGSVDKILSNGNWNPRVYDYLKETWTLLAGASKAFAGLGSGNTRFIAQIRDLGQDTGIMDLFRSMGGGVALGQLMGLSLNQNWENLVENALQDSKMKQIGAGGTLSPIQEAPKNVKDLINFIFNPYNEFGVASSRTNLIDSFITDLFNYRGNNPMMGGNFGANPIMDRATMAWIKERSDILKTWYGGDGNQWVGQDYFYDKNLEPDDTTRIMEFDRSWWTAGKDYYDMANRAHIELGLGDKFGPIPRQDWFAARAAQGFQTGGVVYAQTGGHMVNFQPRGTDTVPAMLTPGEFVVNRSATQKHLPLLTAINDGVQPYNVGGVVYAQTGGKLSLRRELPSTKPRPQVIDPKDIPDVEIPEPVVKTPEQPKRGSGGRTYGSLDMGFGSGSIEYDGNNQQKLGRSKSPRNYGPIDMQGLEIDNEAPSVDGRNNNKGKQGIPPPFIRKHISPTAKSLGGIVYAQTGGIVYAQDGGGVSPRNKVATAMHRQRQKEISEFNQLMLDAQLAQRELEILLFGPSKETKYLLKNTIFDNDQNMLGLYESMSKLRSQKAPPAILDYMSAQAAQANQGLQEIAAINMALRTVAGKDKQYGTWDDQDSGLGGVSTALSALSIGVPVVADLANIPVDLLRGDIDGVMMSAASAGLDIFGGYGGAGISAAKTASMTAGLGLFGVLGKTVKTLDPKVIDDILFTKLWKNQDPLELLDETYRGIPGKKYSGASQSVKDAYSAALNSLYDNLIKAKSADEIDAAVATFNKTQISSSGRTIDATTAQVFPDAQDALKAAMPAVKIAGGTRGLVKYGIDKLLATQKLLINKKTLGASAVAALGLAALRGKPGALIRRGGEVGQAVGTPDNIRLPAAPVPEGALTQAEVDAIKADNRVSRQQSEDRRLANKADRRETLLKDLSKKDNNGIPKLVADAYNMSKDRGRFLGRFSSKTLTREQALNPSLEVLKSNIHADRTVQNVLDLLKFEGFDTKDLQTKLLDNEDYYARGGVVYANQGMMIPYEPRGTDTVPAMLTPGEFVVNRAATQKNLPLLKAINNGSQAYAKGGVVYAAEGGEFPKNRVRQLEKDADARITSDIKADEARRQKIEDAIEQRNRERDAVAYKPRRSGQLKPEDVFDNPKMWWGQYTEDAFVKQGIYPGLQPPPSTQDIISSAPSYEQRRLKTLIRAGKLAHEEGATTKDKEDQNARQQILDQIYQNRDAATSKLERISTGKDIGAVDETDPQKLYQRYEQTALDRFLQWYFYKSKANAGESQRDFLKRTRSAWDSDFDFDNPYSFNNVVTRSKGESEERFVEELIKQGLNAVEAFEKYPALPKKFLSTLEFATINNLSDSQRESLFAMEDQIDPGMEALNIAIQQMIDDKNKQFAEAQKAQAKAVADKAAQNRPQAKVAATVEPGMKMFSQIAERRWEDSTGQHSTIGTLQELIGDKVRISKLNGKTTLMPVSQLSTADQNYIRELQEVRNWTDDTGKYKTQARVIGVGKQGIMIQKLDGSTKNVPMNRLSKQDQDYLRQQYADVLASKPSKPKTQTKDVGVSSEDIPSQDSEPPINSSGLLDWEPQLPTSSDGWVGDYYGVEGRPKDTEERYPMRREYYAIVKQLQQAERKIFRKEGNEIIPQNLTLPWNEAENKQWGDVFNKIYEFEQKYKTIPDGSLLVGLRNEALGKALKLYEAHRVAYSTPARMQKQAEAEIARWSEKQKKYQYKIDKSRILDPMEEGFVVGLANTLRPFGEVNLVPRTDELTDGRTNQLYLKRIQKEVFDASKFLSSYYGLEDVYEGIASYKEKGLQDWLNSNQARKPSYRQYGGPIYASNGTLVNYQPRGTDTVPAMLTPGEFVVNRAATQKHLPLLKSINSGGEASGFADGGIVYLAAGGSAPNHQSVVDNFNNKLLSVASNKKQSDLLYEIKDSSITSNKQLNQVQNKNIPDILKNANNGFSSVGDQLKDINQANMAVQKAITNTNRRSDISNNNTPQDIYTDAITTVNSTSSLDEKSIGNSSSKPDYSKYEQPIYANNGTLVNYQPRGTDTVPAMLTPGEFVVNRQAAQKNLPLLQAINSNNYSRGGVVYMAAAGLVPMTPEELEGAASDPRDRRQRGQPPLNRQEQKERQQQVREQKQQAEIKRKRFLSLSPMMRILIQEINSYPEWYDDFDNNAIDEQLDSAELVQKIDEKIKDVGDPSPAGTAKKQKIFMDRGISDFNRFNQLMRWHTNSKNALEYKGTKETDFLDPQTGLPRVVGDFIDKYPAQKQLGFRAILSTQKTNSIKEASAIRNGWITLARRHNNLFNGMSPEQIINGIITTATKPKAFNNGGVVYANNGMLIPYQPKGTDTVPAMLTPGEFVVNRESTRQNLGLLRAINSNSYANGGVVKYLSEGTAGGLSFTKILSSFTSGIQRAAAAIDTLLTTLQNTSGGVNNDSGSVSVGGLDGLGQFTAKFDQFITQLSKLNLPPEINVNGNHKVDVVINGAQALQELLDGPLSGLIRREVQSAFSRLRAESEGSIPDPTKQ